LVVKMLIDSGADVNAVDSQGRTPADIAAAAGYHDIADTLRQSRITSVRQP
jgi:ankyrin repeat protein